MTSDAEKAFLTMYTMVRPEITLENLTSLSDVRYEALAMRYRDVVGITQRLCLKPWVQCFPIVASTFEALTIERPELREHFDRAKEAWEASQ